MMRSVNKVFAVVVFLAASMSAAAAESIKGLSYSPSNLQSPTSEVSEAAVRRDLEALRAVTNHVRTYNVDFGLDRVPAIARTLGMRVTLGLYIGKEAARNDAQIVRGIKIIEQNADVIDRIIVGNETIEHGGLTPDEIIAYIRRVKAEVPGMQVGTAENWHIWKANPHLGKAVDFIGVHLLPYWDGVSESTAVNYAMNRYKEMAALFPGRTIVVGETGWPSAGETRQAAVPSLQAQSDYVRGFIAQAKNLDYFVIEAFDQPWKAASFENSVGPHWGVFDTARNPKFKLAP